MIKTPKTDLLTKIPGQGTTKTPVPAPIHIKTVPVLQEVIVYVPTPYINWWWSALFGAVGVVIGLLF